METCEKCGTHGCVDEFDVCKEWSRKGYCSKYADFMVYNCRESCGTCGFRSDVVTTAQIIDGKNYSNVTDQHFFCGTSSDNTQTRNVNPRTQGLFNTELLPFVALPDFDGENEVENDVSLRMGLP